jgi:3-phytase
MSTERAVTVAERWLSPLDSTWEVDSPALWVRDGRGRVVVTGRASSDLELFDAATGAWVGAFGGEGAAPGRFAHPNGVAVVGDLALVVDRDNRRVQVLHLPGGEPAGAFGQDVLERPYGIAVVGALPELTVWISDDYLFKGDGSNDLDRRLHRFRLRVAPDGTPTVTAHHAFGDPEGFPGALWVVESVAVDPAHDRVLAVEDRRRRVLVYDTAGAYAGVRVGEGVLAGDPEGIARVPCAGAPGYWIVADVGEGPTVFRLFRLDDLGYVGAFRGRATRSTDGVVFAPAPVPGFDGAAFFATHADGGVSAFAWEDVVEALELDPRCAGPP